MAQGTMYFPRDFWWGTATSAYQVEGNNQNSDWWAWDRTPGAILDGSAAGVACDWWRNAERDLDAAAEMGNNAHRLSLAWDRIEPEPARFDAAALGRYREILRAMRDRGIEPMVTLHHFVNPQWLVEKGDFGNGVAVDYFRRFVGKVVDELGDLVTQWVTINEPLVYVFFRYLDGVFPPPQARGWDEARAALRNLLRCHAAAYHTIKARQPESLVGYAKQIRPIRAVTANPAARAWAGALDRLFNDVWLRAVDDGRLRFPFGRGKLPHLAGSADFIGVNYYAYSLAAFPPWPGRLLKERYPAGTVVGDGNYGAVEAAGLFDAIKRVLPYGKPIVITENGIPDDDDDVRPGYLLTHLREIWRAVSFNFPVLGYYHWSLVDNFEWERGWTQRFGLIELDPATQARTWRPSARLYQDICRSNSISSEQAATYAPEVLDVLFPG